MNCGPWCEGAGTKEIRIPASTGIAGAVIHGDDVLIIHDAYADPRFQSRRGQRIRI